MAAARRLLNLSDVIESGTPETSEEWIATDLTVPGDAQRLVISVAVSAAATFSITFNSGTTWVLLNGGDQLAADELYDFLVAVEPGELVNFRAGSDVTVRRFLVDGQVGGV